MTPRRVFLGWDRPLCETVPEYLLSEIIPGRVDFTSTLVVVPTRQSASRLRESLALAARQRRYALLGPEIVTPSVLLGPPPSRDLASPLARLLAWKAVLESVDGARFPAFLRPLRRRSPPSGAALLHLAQRLDLLRAELADGGLTVADVAQRADIEEKERWADIASMEHRYLEQLHTWRLRDLHAAKLDRALRGAVPHHLQRIVLAGLPDPTPLLLILLNQWNPSRGVLECLVAAPASEAAAFDPWGRPLPEIWSKRRLPTETAETRLLPTPEDEAHFIVQRLMTASDGPAQAAAKLHPDVALGLADPEVIGPLHRELAAHAVWAFDPRNRPFSSTRLYTLLESLFALKKSPGYPETATFLRHPDVLAASRYPPDALLEELDQVQSCRLPVTLEDLWLAVSEQKSRTHRISPLQELLARVRQWLERLDEAPLDTAVRNFLQEIYADRIYPPGDPHGLAFEQSAAVLDMALRELETLPTRPTLRPDLVDAFLLRLRHEEVTPERGEEVLDLEGWLELLWDPAPHLFVAGLNEGYVPDSRLGDLFLPNRLREQFQLRDDRRRASRDAYVLTAALEQRRETGSVVLLLAKTTLRGDPLRPSRLLFQCSEEVLVSRARALFRPPPLSRLRFLWSPRPFLDPNQIPDAPQEWKKLIARLPVTAFRDYLACPFRFYLRHALGMKPLDDRQRELDAAAFGTLLHQVCRRMAEDPDRIWACGNGHRLARWLEQCLWDCARATYGPRPWAGVQLAIESALRRLRAFAFVQVEWHARGWEIVATPEQKVRFLLEGTAIEGKIDRIDRHAGSGAICILDYKTSDQTEPPQKAHLKGLVGGKPPHVPESVLEMSGTMERRKRWVDLQLPLYRQWALQEYRQAPGIRIAVGYIALPRSTSRTRFWLWTPPWSIRWADEGVDPAREKRGEAIIEDPTYTADVHEAAMRCAQAVIARIRDGLFWPPAEIPPLPQDEFSELLLDFPRAILREPQLRGESA